MRTPSDVLCKRLDELAHAVAAGPAAIAREFTMCIPAQPDRDADIVLSDAAQHIRELKSALQHIRDYYYSAEMCRDIAAAALDGRDDYKEPPR